MDEREAFFLFKWIIGLVTTMRSDKRGSREKNLPRIEMMIGFLKRLIRAWPDFAPLASVSFRSVHLKWCQCGFSCLRRHIPLKGVFIKCRSMNVNRMQKVCSWSWVKWNVGIRFIMIWGSWSRNYPNKNDPRPDPIFYLYCHGWNGCPRTNPIKMSA